MKPNPRRIQGKGNAGEKPMIGRKNEKRAWVVVRN